MQIINSKRRRRSRMRTGTGELLVFGRWAHRERERGRVDGCGGSMQIINSKRRRRRMRTGVGELLVLFGR